MGLIDKSRQVRAENEAGIEAGRQAAAGSGCTGNHYVTEVNRGSINMGAWQQHLNDMHAKGYRLQHVFEQDKNTVQVFEHHWC